MYYFSKIVGALLNPVLWVVVLLAMALFGSHRNSGRSSRRLTGMAWGLLLFMGWGWPPARLMLALENSNLRPTLPVKAVSGIVVLGGMLGPEMIAAARQQVPLNDAAERMTETMALARRHPAWTVVFAGGGGQFLEADYRPEASLAAELWQQQDLPLAQLKLEDRSRNTAENAVFAARLPGIDPKANWLLVTSAWHMPRAMAIFQKAGWHVIAWPVDYRADPMLSNYSLVEGPRLWQLVLKEYVGRLAGGLQVLGAGS